MLTSYRRRIIPFLLCQIPLWTAMWLIGRIIREPLPQTLLSAHPTYAQVERATGEDLDSRATEMRNILIAGIAFTLLAHGVDAFWHKRKRALNAV